MEKTEMLEDFYKEKLNISLSELSIKTPQFAILTNEECINGASMKYRRRDFYKVSLFKGRVLLHYGDKSLEIDGIALVFFNPDVPYTVEMLEETNYGGYFIFSEAYINDYLRSNIRDFPLFTNGTKPVYLLNKVQEKVVDNIFKRVHQEMATNYAYKHDLIRHQILELIHIAQQLMPSEKIYQNIDSKTRITNVFLELLDRQFPVESPNEEFEMRSAGNYAGKMGLHINYLNRAVKSVSGKTTTAHITERITSEAITLLKHSDWNISEISNSLGFVDLSHFNHFFKKQTKQAPSSYRSTN
ncbi:AraC-like DNA-binding protein [Pedobacter cryoconitis]|uniref:AraC-like DNA-binding protein n=1 Tax=Pedobacter cryoconitis TaxID=188932 RepID=A0A7W8ZQ40_9SPHI|nr:helix-turn-helix domain-containing protein [Pedobacter cryoconitis]MBB5638131.1 AraC-like DNA-binding protein [Pedobacter cryoconitis]